MGIKSDNGEKDYMKGGYIKTTDFKTVKDDSYFVRTCEIKRNYNIKSLLVSCLLMKGYQSLQCKLKVNYRQSVLIL